MTPKEPQLWTLKIDCREFANNIVKCGATLFLDQDAEPQKGDRTEQACRMHVSEPLQS